MANKFYSAEVRRAMIEQALDARYNERKNWDEIADDLSMSRSTLSEWRKDDDFKEADSIWRRNIANRIRGDSTQMLDDAITTIYQLMKTDKSGYVRYMSACKIIDMNIGNETEEVIADQQKELNNFLLKEAKRVTSSMAELKVGPNGALPVEVQQMNAEYRDRKRAEAESLEAEWHEVTNAQP